jgi:hypothetical protein
MLASIARIVEQFKQSWDSETGRLGNGDILLYRAANVERPIWTAVRNEDSLQCK